MHHLFDNNSCVAFILCIMSKLPLNKSKINEGMTWTARWYTQQRRHAVHSLFVHSFIRSFLNERKQKKTKKRIYVVIGRRRRRRSSKSVLKQQHEVRTRKAFLFALLLLLLLLLRLLLYYYYYCNTVLLYM